MLRKITFLCKVTSITNVVTRKIVTRNKRSYQNKCVGLAVRGSKIVKQKIVTRIVRSYRSENNTNKVQKFTSLNKSKITNNNTKLSEA
jgi:hypothetical protein